MCIIQYGSIPISVWTGLEVLPGTSPEAGKHYVVNEEDLRDHHDFIALAKTHQLHQLRHEWILRRANRPYVLEPDGIPMPDAAANAEEQTRLYSVYLRPWVLDHGDASLAVPHITDLNLCAAVGQANSKRKRLRAKT